MTIFLIIDTENYSGNFEREICAYVTGQLNEDPRSDHEHIAENATIKHISWWNDHICRVKHEEYGYVVTQIWKTDGWFNNGMGKHYRDDGTHETEALEECRKSMEAYQAPHIAQAQYRLDSGDYGDPRLGWNKETCESAIANYRESIENAGKLPRKCPAYMSVAISVDEIPPEDVWQEFQQRAKDFCANHTTSWDKKPSPLTLTGFRKIKVETKTIETVLD